MPLPPERFWPSDENFMRVRMRDDRPWFNTALGDPRPGHEGSLQFSTELAACGAGCFIG